MWLNFVKWAKFLTCVKILNKKPQSHKATRTKRNSLYLRVFLKVFLNS